MSGPARCRVYDVVDVRPVRRWLTRADAPFRAEAGRTVETRETHLDTEDWRFHRAGLILFLRVDGDRIDATTAPRGKGKRRSALPLASAPLAEARTALLPECPGPVGQRVRALAGSRSVDPLFELHSRREAFAIRLGESSLATLTLDETIVPMPGGGSPARLSRVEIDCEGANGELPAFLRSLELACGLRPTPTSKYDAALITVGLAPPDPPRLGPTEVDRTASASETARAVLRKQLLRLVAHEPGTRLGEDIEELHDMRVATRRIRAALRLFEEHLPRQASGLRTELGWLGRVLGEVRDLDVQQARIESWQETLAAGDRAALEVVAARLRDRRVAARRRLLRALDSRRYERLIGRAQRLFRQPKTRRASPRILQVAPDLILGAFRKVVKSGDRLSPESPASDFHRMRIRCKALRYALEFHRGAYGKPLESMIRPLIELQDLLGEHQDAAVASDWLRDLVLTRGRKLPAHTIYVAGMLAQRHAAEARRLRRRFRKRYAKVKGKRRRKLRDHLTGLMPPPSVPTAEAP